jgi:WD40 repeat protein
VSWWTPRPSSPYKGLAPFAYSDLDALLFFGRDRERDIVVANLVGSRLTVLYGPTGVGKSSLLGAGVAHRLQKLARANLLRSGSPEHAVVVVNTWTSDPASTVAEAVAAEIGGDSSSPLVDTIETQTRRGDLTLYLILDQFEEYFLYHAPDEAEPLCAALPQLLRRSDLRVNVLLALRDDALGYLDVFKGRIPNLFANPFRLDRLDRRSARAACVGPIERYNELVEPAQRAAIEPALVERVLDHVTAGSVDFGHAGIGEVRRAQAERTIEAPYLQLVLERLWQAEQAAGSRVLRLATLEQLGGAEAIVRAHLDHALQALTPAQQDLAARVFNHLVTPSGTKIAHRASDLADYVASPEEELNPVLAALGRERVLRAVDGNGAGAHRYEIFHDVLADAVLGWRTRRETETVRRNAERRHRRLALVAAAALAGLALAIGLTIFAFSERSNARAQARRSHGRELAASAVAQLDANPQRALNLALRAARLDPTAQIEDVLRNALLAARLRKLLHVGSPVAFVALAASHLVTGSRDGVRVWDASSGRLARTLRDGNPLIATAYDPDHDHILTAGRNAAHVWNASSGQLIATLRHYRISSAAFSPDGSETVTGGGDRRLRVWRTRDATLLHVSRLPGASRLIAISPNDQRIVAVVTAAGETKSHLIDARNGHVLRTLPQQRITHAEFSPEGPLLATSSADGSTRLWRSRDGRPVRTLNDHGSGITDLTFSPDGSLLATASSDGVIRVWQVADGQRSFYFTTHTAPTRHVAFNSTGTLLVSTGDDQTARVFQLAGIEQGQQVALLAGHAAAVETAAFSQDGTTVMTGSEDGTAGLWDARTEQRLGVAATEKTTVARARFADDGRQFVDIAGPHLEVHRPGQTVSSYAIAEGLSALSDDGRLTATLDPAGHVVVRSLPDGRALATLHPTARVTALSFQTHAHALATASADGVITIWDFSHGRILSRFRAGGPSAAIAVAPQGNVVLTASPGGGARLWTRKGKLLHVLAGHPQTITDARFDPTGARVVTAAHGVNRNAIVWDVRTGGLLHVLIGHYGTVSAASFSFDGRWILTAGPISAAIWNADTGRLLFYLRGPTALLTDAESSPAGYRVITGSRDRTVRTYDCRLCKRLDGLAALAGGEIAAAR